MVTLRYQLNTNAQPPAPPRRLSLVTQTVQSLREGMQSGYWQAQLPGERELCAHLQVSRRTLRAALTILQQQGCFKTARGRRRRIQESKGKDKTKPGRKILAVLSANAFLAMPPTTMLVLEELRDKLAQVGYAVELHVNRACFAARPQRALQEVTQQHPATAWLIFGSKEPMQRWFIERKLPCLVMGSCAPGIALPSVDWDYRAVCRHAGGVLLRKGHRRLCLVVPRDAYGGDLTSEAGLRESLLPLKRAASLLVLRHDGTAAHLRALVDQMLRQPSAPTAFLVARAIHALTVVTHLLQGGKRLPQDVAVISRDNDPFFQFVTPAVSRYSMDPAQFARRLSVAVARLAETGTLPMQAVRLIPAFVPGQTV